MANHLAQLPLGYRQRLLRLFQLLIVLLDVVLHLVWSEVAILVIPLEIVLIQLLV